MIQFSVKYNGQHRGTGRSYRFTDTVRDSETSFETTAKAILDEVPNLNEVRM